ncbi:hypothetical protein CCR94_15335 [Rhodoblastus sphagnicola]|uniref:DUF1236 domain-containing protein n=2 Tax=Rhodoblastus sphagnicola TaxID=333368 RepID=A0A2S6N4E2_9HYPH|nr:hypothetical protein CCR94_15335 [Rhodoblastus sphagnicola]
MNTIAVTTIVFLALSGAAVGQGAVPGADDGSRKAYRVAGPFGAVVGGATGAVVGGPFGAIIGGAVGLLGVDQRPRFLEYASRSHHDSYTYDRQLDVGAVLPDDGVTYYDIPPEYNVPLYKYAIVNGRTVLVDPRNHRVMQIID